LPLWFPAAKDRCVSAPWQLDDDSIVFPFAHVIFSQPGAKPAGFSPHYGVLRRIMVRFAPKDLDRNYGLFELVMVAFQMPFGQEPEESAHPLVAKESGARQDPFQLLARAFGVCRRDGHGSEYTSCFQRCANV
jgi:hypothetical protein